MADLQELTAALTGYGYDELSQHIAVAYHPLVGQDVWGKEAKVHYYADIVKIEQFPPGGKTRGKKTGILSFEHSRSPHTDYLDDSKGDTVMGFLHDIAKYIKKKSWADLVRWIKKEIKYRKDAGERVSLLEDRQQKAVHAPNPAIEFNSPKDFTNIKKVKVHFDTQGREIALDNLNDKMNEPRAITLGPRAYEKAIRMLGDWQGMLFRDILVFWGKNGIKYHDWLAMD